MSHGEYIRIKNTKNSIQASGKSVSVEYQDPETGMFCMYIPSLQLHSYGDTMEEAEEMLDESMKMFFDNLFTSSLKKIESELYRLGWSKKKFKQKEFFPIVDLEERLKEEKIENYKVSELNIAA